MIDFSDVFGFLPSSSQPPRLYLHPPVGRRHYRNHIGSVLNVRTHVGISLLYDSTWQALKQSLGQRSHPSPPAASRVGWGLGGAGPRESGFIFPILYSPTVFWRDGNWRCEPSLA